MTANSKPKLRTTPRPRTLVCADGSRFVFDGIDGPIRSYEMIDGTISGTLDVVEPALTRQMEYVVVRSSARNRHERRAAGALERKRGRRAAL